MPLDPRKVQEIFLQIVALPLAVQAQELRRFCGSDRELQDRVEALLTAHLAAIRLQDPLGLSFGVRQEPVARSEQDAVPGLPGLDSLRSAIPQPLLETTALSASRDAVAGTVIAGRYTLQEKIGEGGMGEVWVAKQTEPIKRSVALKLIKAGMDSKAVLGRFEQERQALAIMDHPNIARVLDGGLTPTGQPFFAMELVKGLPITDYCDRMRLSPEKRLELFLPVCNAIQHAHQKGIIHRDIKPSNVLVALYDDQPIPKVKDFGVAKATGSALTEHTISTGFGGVVGTPQYMSPEQATLNNLDIDTRSDVYSLGVLLYELLAGTPPFAREDLHQQGILEILRVVREVEPPRPSMKLSSSFSLPTLSASRSMEPGKLTRLLRSELDWIVLKELEKERSRRYETATSFAADISRYLAGERVLAHPPSWRYQFWKMAKRNRGLLVTSSLIAIAFVTGLIGTTWQLYRAEFEATRANAEAIRANEEASKAEKARDATSQILISSYLRPIGYNASAVDPAELVALRDISQNPDDRLKIGVLKQALSDKSLATRVSLRVPEIAQSAVGLSLRRQQEAKSIASSTFGDATQEPEVKSLAFMLTIELGIDEATDLRPFSDWIKSPDNPMGPGQLEFLSPRLPESRNADLMELCISIIEQSASTALIEIAKGQLQSRLEQMDPSEIQKISDRLKRVPIASPGIAASQEIQLSIAGRLSAEKPMQTLLEIMDLVQNGAPISSALFVLASSIVSKLDDEKFPIGLERLGELYQRADSRASLLYDAKERLYLIARRVSPSKAAFFFDLFMEDIGYNYNEYAIVGVGLAELVRRLSPEDGKARFVHLKKLLKDTRSQLEITDLIQPIAMFARSPDPDIALDAYHLLVENLHRTEFSYGIEAALVSYTDLAPKLDPAEARKGFYLIAKNTNLLEQVPPQSTDAVIHDWNPETKGAFSLDDSEAPQSSVVCNALLALGSRIDRAEVIQAWKSIQDTLLTGTKQSPDALSALLPLVDDESLDQQLDQLNQAITEGKVPVESLDLLVPYIRALLSRINEEQYQSLLSALRSSLSRHEESIKEATIPLLIEMASRIDNESLKSLYVELQSLPETGTTDSLRKRANFAMAAVALQLSDERIVSSYRDLFRMSTDDLRQVAQPPRWKLQQFEPAPGSADAPASQPMNTIDIIALSKPELLELLSTKMASRDIVEPFHLTLDFIATAEVNPPNSVANSLLVLLAQRVDKSDVPRVKRALVAVLSDARYPSSAFAAMQALLALPQPLDQPTQAMIVQSAQSLLLDASFDSVLPQLLDHVHSIELIANLLREPTCIGTRRDQLLHRLEQIANENSSSSPTVKQPSSLSATPQQPLGIQFHVLADASKWLAKTHPTIDLDAPYIDLSLEEPVNEVSTPER